MARLSVQDLQQMKRDGKKIAAAVVYEYQMTKICERAGVDLLSVGDSLGHAFLGYESGGEHGIDETLVFARAVTRTAQSAVVNVDMPTSVCTAGATAVLKAAKRIKEEAGADLTKVDLREHEEELFDEVQAVIEAGLAATQEATRARPRAAVSASMCPASASRARLWESSPPATSASM